MMRPDDAARQPPSAGSTGERGGTFAELRGDPYQQGLAQGRIAARHIATNVRITRQVAAELGAALDYRALTRANEQFVRDASPGTLAEVAGLADGAGLPYDEVLALNLPAAQTAHFLPRECTQLLVRPGATRDGHTYLAKNRDNRRPYRQIVLRRWLDDERWVVQANVAGSITWPGIGVNSAGLALATSGLWSRRTEIDWDSANAGWLMLNTDLLLRDRGGSLPGDQRTAPPHSRTVPGNRRPRRRRLRDHRRPGLRRPGDGARRGSLQSRARGRPGPRRPD
jgi:hypothetical protein